MESYSISKHCSSCAWRDAGILQEKSKPVGDVQSALLQAALNRLLIRDPTTALSALFYIPYLPPP